MRMKAKRPKRLVFEFDRSDAGLPTVASPDVMLSRILAPVDFSECSEKAARYATTLARQFNSEVVFLHVVRPLTPALSPELVVLDTDPMNVKLHEEAAKQLARWRRKYVSMARVKAVVRSGFSIQKEIIDAARETDADLIVLGAHDKSGLAHLFSGSVAEQVVRHAPCPVLVLREHERDFVASEDAEAEEEPVRARVPGRSR